MPEKMSKPCGCVENIRCRILEPNEVPGVDRRNCRLPKIEQKVREMLAGSCEDVVGPRYLQGYENALEAVLKLFEEE